MKVPTLLFLLSIVALPLSAQNIVTPGLLVPQVTAHSATLSWTTSTSVVDGYNVYRRTGTTPAQRINPAQVGGTQYVDLAVTPGVTYYYTVRAVRADAVESIDSNEVQGTIPSAPTPPPPLLITTSAMPNGTVGAAYPGLCIVTTGGTPPYATVGIGLAPGLTLSGPCISGQPTAAGTFTANFTVTDAAGAVATRSYPMTVLPEPPPPSALISLWTLTSTPANLNGNDGSSVELGVKFSSSAAGSIVGIRFYKAGNSGGTHSGSLWNAAGTRLATGTFTNETLSGWQTLTFTAPVVIAAGATYTASYHTAQYVWNQSYFTAPRISAPLTAPVNAGVYRYGTASAFPSLVYQASNYWVDVLFLPSGPPPVSITVAPTSTTILTGASRQFTATVSNSSNQGVTWTATGGTIAASGLYTAGGTAGGFSVTARSVADTTKTATASVTITPPPPSLTVNCPAAVAAFTAANMPPGSTLTITGTAGGAPPATCSAIP